MYRLSLAPDDSTQTTILSNKIGKLCLVYLELVLKNVVLMEKKKDLLVVGHHSLILVSSGSGWKHSFGSSRRAGISSCNPQNTKQRRVVQNLQNKPIKNPKRLMMLRRASEYIM